MKTDQSDDGIEAILLPEPVLFLGWNLGLAS